MRDAPHALQSRRQRFEKRDARVGFRSNGVSAAPRPTFGPRIEASFLQRYGNDQR